MTTAFLDAVFKPFFKIVHDTGQQPTIDRTNFLTDGFLQIIQRTGFMSVNTRFKIPPKEQITRWKIGTARGTQHVSETGNEVPGKHVSNNGHWLVCSVHCGTILLKVANQEDKMRTTLSPHSAYLPSTTHSKDVGFPWVTLYFIMSTTKDSVYTDSQKGLIVTWDILMQHWKSFPPKPYL